jgi:hypothetical protein
MADLSLYLSTMSWKRRGVVERKLHSFQALEQNGGAWSAPRSASFTTTERIPSTLWIGGHTIADVMAKSGSLQGIESCSSSP